MSFHIIDPRGERPPTAAADPLQILNLTARRLSVIDNSKPRFDIFVKELVEEICSRHGASPGPVFRKPNATIPPHDAWLTEIQQQGGAAIVGWGDCGSCSTGSFLDGVKLVSLGVPTVVVISEAFRGLIAGLAKMNGFEHVPRLVLPHPPTALNDEDLKALARARADEVIALLGVQTQQAAV